ncbi:prolyl aminopeptidase protein [Colletotrichum truncatum]|uniref:Prolyl aminopeptidase protein n=1 Tax=Colletotrichum truncatum TaxID=5467 RepID=A0ACC3Z705_COLTU
MSTIDHAQVPPVVVVVPGSFAPAKLYDTFTAVLRKHGIESEVVDTPSVGIREGLGPQSMSDDVAEIVKVVSDLLEKGKQVILLTHSYGGIPGTQSLQQLSRVSREAAGKAGGIDKIIYLTAIVPPVGVGNFDFLGTNVPDFLTVDDDYMRITPEGTASLTFSDLPPGQALEAAKQMSEHSTPSFKEKLTYPGYNDVEVHYIVCEEDRLVLPEHQLAMVEFLKGSTGRDINVHKLQSGHAPVASQPENLAKIVAEICGGAESV